MKKHILFIFLLLSAIGYAQNGINYKALIKDDLGNIVVNKTTNVLFSILQNEVEVYREVHTTNTDDNGLVIVTIGEGNVLLGVYDAINWEESNHSLTVQIDTGSGLINLGTTPFNAVPYALSAANVTGLEAIDEGSGVGWRLKGNDSEYYGNIGGDAVDLSNSITVSSTNGATGFISFASGLRTQASGNYSVAMGLQTTASNFAATALGNETIASGENTTALGRATLATGDNALATGRNTEATGTSSTAMGSYTEAIGHFSFAIGHESSASGETSIAMGRDTQASGENSTAMGNNTTASSLNSTAMGENTTASSVASTAMGGDTTASGAYSTAMGRNTTASGVYSTAMGFSTNSDAFRSIAIGSFNIGGGMPSSWTSTDPLFEIGNGSSNDNRNNAVTVLKNGNVGIGTHTPQDLLHLVGGHLRIGNETIEDGGSDILAFSSSLVPTVDGVDRLGGPNRKWLDVYATNGAIQTSDRREKKNIETLKYGLEEVLKMTPVSFNWKNKNNPDLKLGLIAQDIQTLIPEVVKSHSWEINEVSGELIKKELDRLGVYYSDLIPVLIKAIQEQQQIINNQKSIITKQDKTNVEQTKVLEALLSRVDALENINNQ